jgi:hypothetical protein
MKFIIIPLLIAWMLVSSLSIVLGQASGNQIISYKDLTALPGKKYVYLEDKFRAIQKLEAKADYCDSIAVVSDSIIHHQRDKIQTQAIMLQDCESFAKHTSQALTSATIHNQKISNQLTDTKKEKQDANKRTAFAAFIALIFGVLLIAQ